MRCCRCEHFCELSILFYNFSIGQTTTLYVELVVNEKPFFFNSVPARRGISAFVSGGRLITLNGGKVVYLHSKEWILLACIIFMAAHKDLFDTYLPGKNVVSYFLSVLNYRQTSRQV